MGVHYPGSNTLTQGVLLPHELQYLHDCGHRPNVVGQALSDALNALDCNPYKVLNYWVDHHPQLSAGMATCHNGSEAACADASTLTAPLQWQLALRLRHTTGSQAASALPAGDGGQQAGVAVHGPGGRHGAPVPAAHPVELHQVSRGRRKHRTQGSACHWHGVIGLFCS